MADKREFAVYNMRETYHEMGSYEFKIVLSPGKYKNGHESAVSMMDSDGKLIDVDVKKWGRKINCSFKIDENVADGVSLVRLDLCREDGSRTSEELKFWVVK